MEIHLMFFQLLQFSLLIVLFKTFKVIYKQILNQKPDLPPGPWKLPIIGNIHQVIGELPHRRVTRLAQSHGPFLYLKLGEIHYVIASTSAAATEILKTHDIAFASRPSLLAIKTIAYNCAGMGFSPYGPYWRQLRRICLTEILSNKRVKSFISIRQEEAVKAISDIRSGEQGMSATLVNLTEVFLRLTNNHLTRAAFGKECRSRERFINAMKETIKLAPVVSLVDLFPSLATVMSKLDGKMKKMKELHFEIDSILNEIIEDHRERSGNGGSDQTEDLLDVLLRVQEKEDLEIPLKMFHIKAVILDMLVAATETTSSTLVWIMAELIRHPEIMHKVQSEIRETLKEKETMDENDIGELSYLKQVIKETMRLHPPLPLLIPRTCSESVQLSGFTVPAGSRVMVNAWAIGRDPKTWENPEIFCPERFKDGSMEFGSRSFDYIPFGGGRRKCPGMGFGMAGIELFLATLLFHFDWKLPHVGTPAELDMEEEFDGTLRKKNDLCLLAIPYNPLETAGGL